MLIAALLEQGVTIEAAAGVTPDEVREKPAARLLGHRHEEAVHA